MKNFVQIGNTISVTAPTGGLVSGAPVLIGAALFGVAAYSADAGASGEIVTAGVFDLPKGSGAFAVGDKAYWDATNKVITATATDSAWVGVVTEAALASASTVRVRLNHHPII